MGPLDIAIPLAKCRNNYNELRYTLRSIDQYFPHRNIYLIGEKPSWVHNVIHIPMNDIPGRKAFSIFRKMMAAAKLPEVSDPFISWSDDTYLMQPITEIKDWYSGTLAHWAKANIHNQYKTIVARTWKMFPDGLFFNVHAPCAYQKDRFIDMARLPFSSMELLVKSTYFNSGPSNPVEMTDPKIQKGIFYSSGHEMKTSEILMLNSLFPNPSKYETNHKANTKAA